jgi:hypothetical protein
MPSIVVFHELLLTFLLLPARRPAGGCPGYLHEFTCLRRRDVSMMALPVMLHAWQLEAAGACRWIAAIASPGGRDQPPGWAVQAVDNPSFIVLHR